MPTQKRFGGPWRMASWGSITRSTVIDEVAMPMWLLGSCGGTMPILVVGPQPRRPWAHQKKTLVVTTLPSQCGVVAHVQLPPFAYAETLVLGYHHLGNFWGAGGVLHCG